MLKKIIAVVVLSGVMFGIGVGVRVGPSVLQAQVTSPYAKDSIDERISTARTFTNAAFGNNATTMFNSDDSKSKYCRGFHVNVAGTLKVTGADSGAVRMYVTAGSYYPYAVSKFWNSGTDAALKVSGAVLALR